MDQSKRLDMLVRQGMMPAQNLPILKRAIARVQMGANLLPNERAVIKTFMDEMMYIVFGDDTVFQRAKQHTQKNRYHTEEQIVEQLDEKLVDGVEIVDGEEDRQKAEKQGAKLGRKNKIEKLKNFSKALRKEKERAGVSEQVAKMNEDYKAKFEAALKKFGVSSIRDLPADKKKEFFNMVDGIHKSDSEEKGMDEGKEMKKTECPKCKGEGCEHCDNKGTHEEAYTPKEVRMGKGIANDKRYKGGNYSGAFRTINKVKKGLASHKPVADALKRANEETEVVVEDISKMSDSRLKFHATKGVPHGSYSTKQIKDEHNERKQTKTYQAAKATMNEEEVEEGAMKRLATQQQTGEKGSGLDTFKSKPKDTSQGKKNLQDEMSPEAKANRLQMIKNAARKQAAKNDAAAVAAAKRDYAKSSKRGLAPVKMDESFDVYSMTDEQIALLTKTEAYKLIDHINNILTGE